MLTAAAQLSNTAYFFKDFIPLLLLLLILCLFCGDANTLRAIIKSLEGNIISTSLILWYKNPDIFEKKMLQGDWSEQ